MISCFVSVNFLFQGHLTSNPKSLQIWSGEHVTTLQGSRRIPGCIQSCDLPRVSSRYLQAAWMASGSYVVPCACAGLLPDFLRVLPVFCNESFRRLPYALAWNTGASSVLLMYIFPFSLRLFQSLLRCFTLRLNIETWRVED